jgi:transposase
MQRRPRRSFTAEFKAEAVELVRKSGKSVYQAAKDLDLTETTLREWVRLAEEGKPLVGRPQWSAEREELDRLRRENRELRMERDFLKKAAAFFAKETK